MDEIYLGLGSNIDPEDYLRLAVRELQRRYGPLDISTVYRNPAVGFDGPDFLNLVVRGKTDSGPAEVHDEIESIHDLAGRRRESGQYGSRPLDIDLLLYGDRVLSAGPVRIPRPDILDYGFVLRPLAELAPGLVHPLTGRTMAEHWRAYDASRHPLIAVTPFLQGNRKTGIEAVTSRSSVRRRRR
jgi:2-amino-4-hydroxy-6-hydroxymethyldihydropteridine diphosphokinase